MGYLEYQGSKRLSLCAHEVCAGNAFYSLLMAAMREADSWNASKLQEVYPEVWSELQRRYNAPGGKLEGET